MQVIDLRENDKDNVISVTREMLTERYLCGVNVLQPSSFSFITSTRLANAIKKQRADVVIVDRLKDAIAAVSARKLLTKDCAGFKILYSVSALSHMPTGVPTEVCRGIDCWVFDSKEAERTYSNHEFIEVHSSVIIEPTTVLDLDVEKNRAERNALHITVVGDLADTNRMQRIVRAVGACARDKVELHVYGTGKPRYIMPVVNESRKLDGLNVVWHGETYKLESVIADTDIAVGAYRVASSADIFMRKLGIAVVEPEKIAETVATPEALAAACKASQEEYEKRYSIDVHVRQWHELINSLA